MSKSFGMRIACVALTAATIVAWSSSAFAQGGRGGGMQLDPARAEAVWTLEAKYVAKDLELSEENAAKLKDAFIASRKSLQEAAVNLMEERRASGERGGFEAFQALSDAESASLKKNLAEFLSEEQAGKASASLGTFNWQGDRLVDVLSGLKLDEDKEMKALGLISAYAQEVSALRPAGGDRASWEGMREKMQPAREKLDAALAEVLSAEEAAKWKEQTAPRGGGGGRGAGGGGQGGGRGGDNERPRRGPGADAPSNG